MVRFTVTRESLQRQDMTTFTQLAIASPLYAVQTKFVDSGRCGPRYFLTPT